MSVATLGMASTEKSLQILNRCREAYPAIVLGIFLLGFIIHGIFNAPDSGDKVQIHAMKGPGGRPLPTRRKSANQIKAAAAVKDFSPRAKFVFQMMQTGILITFLLNAVGTILQTLLHRAEQWWPGQSAVIFVVASFFAWSVVLISLVDTTPAPSVAHFITWLVALPLDLIILGLSLQIYTEPHHEPTVGDQTGGKYQEVITPWEVFEVIVYFCRIAFLLGLSTIFLAYKISHRKSSTPGTPTGADGEVRQPLLGQNGNAAPNGHAYGTSPDTSTNQKQAPDAWAKPTETPNITWYAYLKGFMVLTPYLWPRKSLKLQALALTCFIIMISQRIINVYVPILTGKITDSLSGEEGQPVRAPWLYISLYILFKWLQGGQGILGAARTILWIPVEQYSYRAISSAAFEHVHGLSAEFHTGKRTGELISALNKGSAINSFLEMVTFNVGPMIFDLVVAIIYLTAKFDIYLGLVVAIVTFLYIYVTIRLASWRVTLRRNYTNADREMEAVKNDSLHSWDTVKYFNAEQYEFDRYKTSIKAMQKFEYWVQLTLAYMNTVQGALFMIALLIACFIEAFQVAQGFQTVGNFVVLITYMAQLQGPLNFFGTFYRSIQSNLINAERMLELFKEQPHVIDKPEAEDLTGCEGDIVFDNVTFGYNKRKPALDSLSFRCEPGTTTALVGESGGGKTTIMRLMYRYYNPDFGQIRVDGRDVQDMTIDSLRRHIGVVPQDCNMFNETIMYNLRYANQSATDEEIYSACRAASIHDRIMAFQDKYETKVGERGVRLSGGERQRIAIARTILKNPRITLLDEATAALDTETEERIQEAFNTLAEGRTMLIIAHRLSTITEANQILVLSGGTVVERGTHMELIERGGKYASMWRKQSRAQKAAAEAEELRVRAKKALEAAEVDSANVSEDEVDRAAEWRRKTGFYKKAAGGASNHKRVNFSQSSLGRGWTPDEDDTTTNEENRSKQAEASKPETKLSNGNAEGDDDQKGSGKPPGHP